MGKSNLTLFGQRRKLSYYLKTQRQITDFLVFGACVR